MRVLLTCPPMLGMKTRFRELFAAKGIELHCPEVTQTLDEEQLVALLPGFDGWIIGDDPATLRVFQAGRSGRLRAAVKWGIGVDNVDFAAAAALGIPVSNTPMMFGREVADLAMSYVVALARQTFSIDRGIRAGGWPKPRGISLAGRTMALVGFGDIGRNLARRAVAADMEVLAYDPAFQPIPELPGVKPLPWPRGLDAADFIVFTCSLNERNRHMLGADELPLAMPGVRIVNVARGPLIDEAALAAALQAGHVHSVALDVFETEPLPAGSPLRSNDRCIFGSHNGSNTEDAVIRASEKAIAILFDYLGVR
jgi:D-3-phosphoglycerate dehydrogenase